MFLHTCQQNHSRNMEYTLKDHLQEQYMSNHNLWADLPCFHLKSNNQVHLDQIF
nr:MAG TPA: hypothetical protein [Caudoviricetes sp.]